MILTDHDISVYISVLKYAHINVPIRYDTTAQKFERTNVLDYIKNIREVVRTEINYISLHITNIHITHSLYSDVIIGFNRNSMLMVWQGIKAWY